MKYNALPSQEVVEITKKSLEDHGMEVYIAKDKEDAKKKAIDLIPNGAEVMDMTSVTLESLGIAQEVLNSGKFNSVKKKLMGMKREIQGREMQKLGAAPEWAMGSVHAITQDGKVMIASNTGSQLPAYAYGADHVIWVVGMQKIVKDIDEGFKRIYEHSLVLESERAKKAYGVPGSSVNKILIINREIRKGRIHLILVPDVLGF